LDSESQKTVSKRPRKKIALGSLVIFLAFALAGVTIYFLTNDLSLWVFGEHTNGWIVDLWVERLDERETEDILFKYLARYQFVTHDGRKFTGETQLSATEWSRLTVAGPGVAENVEHDLGPGYVEVVYFPLYPEHNRLAEGRLIPVLACAYVPLLVLCWAGFKVGLYLLRD
jgi:hypothetical protein